MDSKINLISALRKQSSQVLRKQLENTDLLPERRQLITTILEKRGVLQPENFEKISSETEKRVFSSITEVCEREDSKLTDSVGEILETVEEYSELSEDQGNIIIGLVKETKSPIVKKVKGEVQEGKKSKSQQIRDLCDLGKSVKEIKEETGFDYTLCYDVVKAYTKK